MIAIKCSAFSERVLTKYEKWIDKDNSKNKLSVIKIDYLSPAVASSIVSD
jgi:hypothetical protein